MALADHDAVREAVDAGERDVQIGQDADRAALDHVLAEAREIARAGGAGVDAGGDRAAAREILGVDAERSAAPIDMRVQVDQPGRDDRAGDVADLGAARRPVRRPIAATRPPAKRDIGHPVDVLRRVDHPAAAQHQIEAMAPLPVSRQSLRRRARRPLRAVEHVDAVRAAPRASCRARRQAARVGAGRLDELPSATSTSRKCSGPGRLDQRQSRRRAPAGVARRLGHEVVRPHADEPPCRRGRRGTLAGQEVHLRPADEAGDELVGRVGGRPSSARRIAAARRRSSPRSGRTAPSPPPGRA